MLIATWCRGHMVGLLLSLVVETTAHGAVTIPPPRNAIDADLPPWNLTVPELPIPFEFWCPSPSAERKRLVMLGGCPVGPCPTRTDRGKVSTPAYPKTPLHLHAVLKAFFANVIVVVDWVIRDVQRIEAAADPMQPSL